jgi:predicted transcriptional regulator
MSSAASLIKRSRHAAGLTQAELARRANVTQPVIARLEREGANPRLDTLDRVIAATGHSLELGVGPEFGIDETMIAADLQLSADERLSHFESFYQSAKALGGAALRGS